MIPVCGVSETAQAVSFLQRLMFYCTDAESSFRTG
jgi:hypothetical protein